MFPRWLSWMFVAVMAYMVYEVSRSHSLLPSVASAPATAITGDAYPALAEAVDVERWKRTISPDYAATMNCSIDAPATKGNLTLKIMEEAVGEGEGAHCGETVTIHLTVWNSAGGKAFAGELPLALGSRELASGLDAGLLGMKPGAVRTLALPPQALQRNKTTKAPAEALKALPAGKLATVTVRRVK